MLSIQQLGIQSVFLALRISSFSCRLLFFASFRSDSLSFRIFLVALASLLWALAFSSFALFFLLFFSFAELLDCVAGSTSSFISSSDSSSESALDCAVDGAMLEGFCGSAEEPCSCADAFLANRAALSCALAFSLACFSASSRSILSLPAWKRISWQFRAAKRRYSQGHV